MDTIKAGRSELLGKIKANRQKHNTEFKTAEAEYRKDYITVLTAMIEDAKAGNAIRRKLELPEPQDHTADYDRVINMLEMSVEEIIEVDAHEFDKYVMDNWPWKAASSASNLYYTSKVNLLT